MSTFLFKSLTLTNQIEAFHDSILSTRVHLYLGVAGSLITVGERVLNLVDGTQQGLGRSRTM